MVESVVLIPVAMVVVFLAVQMCLWAHAATLVQNAADAGEQVATGVGSSPAAGAAEARTTLAATGGQVVVDPQIRAEVLSGDVTDVTVSGNAESIIPWLRLPVSATRVGSDQEFRESG